MEERREAVEQWSRAIEESRERRKKLTRRQRQNARRVARIEHRQQMIDTGILDTGKPNRARNNARRRKLAKAGRRAARKGRR